jgi:hypothetical protein
LKSAETKQGVYYKPYKRFPLKGVVRSKDPQDST